MATQPRRTQSNARSAVRRPIQDIVTSKQAAQFPSVGMTLNNYQYDGAGSRRRRGQTAVKRSRWQRLKSKITLKRTVITLVVLCLLVGAWIAGNFIYNANKLFGGSILDVFNNTKLKGESEGRVNILLAGNSADDAGHSGGELTDSIMLVSIDTKNNKGFMLSIPRDLWVNVADDGYQKINGAYVTGKANGFQKSGYPAGGMGQLEEVVSDSFGLPIHYYALVNYNAMRQAVDAVDGVDVTINSDDPRGLYDPNIDWSTGGPLVRLSNGKHTLDGREALNLARARGDSYNSYGYARSDFTRTEHQRQLLLGLKNKAVSAGTLANPAKLTSLADAIGDNVQTDFKIDEVKRLYEISKKIDSRNVKSISLDKVNGKNLLMSYRTPLGQSALVPAAGIDDYSEIQRFIKQQTTQKAVVQEAASIVVLNGTSTNGLAAKVKRTLTQKDLIVDEIGDASAAGQQATTVIDASAGSKNATKTTLKKLFGPNVTTQNPYANIYEADFIVVVGADQAQQAAGATTTTTQ